MLDPLSNLWRGSSTLGNSGVLWPLQDLMDIGRSFGGFGMKQLSFLIVVTVLSAVGATVSAFWAVLLYYSFAVLRPQALWEWALPGNFRWSLIAALLLMVSCVIHGPRLLKTLRFNPIVLLLILYAVLLFFSMILAHEPVTAAKWGQEYGKVILVAVLASFVLEKSWHIRSLAVMIALALGYIAWDINSKYFFEGGRLDVYHYGYGGLDNNGAGIMLAMGLPFAYVLFFMPKLPWWSKLRWAGLPIVFLLAHAIMMTYSRGAMLTAVVGLLWLGCRHRPRWQILIGALVLALMISVLAGPEIQSRFMSTTQYQQDRSAQHRLSSWAAAWEMVWDRPVFGFGIRNSSLYIHQYGADRIGRTIHNQYLQIAADSGIPALLVYLAVLLVAIGSLFIAQGRCRRWLEDPDRKHDTHAQNIACLGRVWLATEVSLIMFMFGGIFLSLEIFELPYLLMVFAGVAPTLTQAAISNATLRQKKDAEEDVHAQVQARLRKPGHPMPAGNAKLPGIPGLGPLAGWPNAQLPGIQRPRPTGGTP